MQSHLKIAVILVGFFSIVAGAIAIAGDPPADPEADGDWCEIFDEMENEDDYQPLPPNADVLRYQCSKTAKKYRIADDSDQVCNIKTCCHVVIDPVTHKPRTRCKDAYINCETIIVD